MAPPRGYMKVSDLPQVTPVFPLDQALLLPRGQLPLNIFEPRYLNMIDDAMAGDRVIGMIQTRQGGERSRPKLARVGCLGRITGFAETSDGRYLITLTGVARFEVEGELSLQTPYRQVRVRYDRFAHDLDAEEVGEAFDRDTFLDALRSYLARRQLDVNWDTAQAAPPEALVNSLAMALPFEAAEKQALLEADHVEDRCRTLLALLQIDAATDDDEPPRLQ